MEKVTKLRFISIIADGIFIAQAISCALFFNMNNIILLSVGIILLSAGACMATSPYFLLRKKGRSWEKTDKLITEGIYAIIRHPVYEGWIFVAISFTFLAPSVYTIAAGISVSFMVYSLMLSEEKDNIGKFGAEYKEYMNNVPRLNIFKGLVNHRSGKI